MLFFKFKPNGIVPGVGYIRQSLRQSQSEEDGGVCADRNAWVALLDPV
jgi:hypothetical protein